MPGGRNTRSISTTTSETSRIFPSRASCSRTSRRFWAIPRHLPSRSPSSHDHFASQGINVIAAAEARGFIFGAPLALELNAGFVPIRKPGKLPYATIAQEYQLEYGSDKLEVHSDALGPGQRVLLIDDVLATGGTMKACHDLVTSTGALVVACTFLIELSFLGGRAKLGPAISSA